MTDLKTIVSLAKRRGIVFQGSEIYGGLANTWDYGPLGVLLKKNIKDYFWQQMVITRDDMYGIESAILMNSKVWEASGHLENFTDPMVDCKSCKERFRADTLLEGKTKDEKVSNDPLELSKLLKKHDIACPNCGNKDFTEVRRFNLMFKTFAGAVEEKANEIFLRPETAQGIFVNFNNIVNSSRPKLPFGVAQIGKSFRNEITPGNFIFRTREFEQMEIEYFVYPGTELQYFDKWIETFMNFLMQLGLRQENLRIREHEKDELSHYSNKTCDIEFNFPWGWGELMGIASRTDYDLKKHSEYSGTPLTYFDSVTNTHITPYVIEPSLGVERLLLAILFQAYYEEIVKEETRVVLKLSTIVAPIKIAILPLKKNEERIVNKAKEIFKMLSKVYSVQYDDTGSIGKLYRRADEIGTPFCITVDFQTIEQDDTVTVRDRDTMSQIRIPVSNLLNFFNEKLHN
ncbi:MAG: glycine--tRNA ligase [Spirochaetes bacterium]|nr:glycine--tRNA ligase [Spirochaetota bacterium]